MRGKGAGYRSIRLVVAIFQHKKKNKICTSRGMLTGDGESAAHAFGGEGEADGSAPSPLRALIEKADVKKMGGKSECRAQVFA